jgi:hypothetical protein
VIARRFLTALVVLAIALAVPPNLYSESERDYYGGHYRVTCPLGVSVDTTRHAIATQLSARLRTKFSEHDQGGIVFPTSVFDVGADVFPTAVFYISFSSEPPHAYEIYFEKSGRAETKHVLELRRNVEAIVTASECKQWAYSSHRGYRNPF